MDKKRFLQTMLWLREGKLGTRESLLARQSELLRSVVRSAYQSVPFYRDLLRAAAVDPSEIRTVEDLRRLPVTTREQIQAEPVERLVAQGLAPESLSVARTSGSSGFPLLIRHSQAENVVYAALKRRTLQQVGLEERGVAAFVLLEQSPGGQSEVGASGPGDSFRFVRLDCRLPVDEILERLARLNPRTLGGYPGALCHLARTASAAHRRAIRPQLVIAGGEMLTPPMRELIAKTFDAPVTSTYASNEFRWIGGECSETGKMHVVDDAVLVEILDEDGQPVAPGQSGEVVATALHSYAQPFIRYRLGDVAVQGEAVVGGPRGCACGAPFSTLEKIQGRKIDYLRLTSGRSISSYNLTLELVKASPFIQRYQVVQERLDWVRMAVIPKELPNKEALDAVRRVAQDVLGEGVRFDIDIVDRLEQEASGKFRLVRSKLEDGGYEAAMTQSP